MIDKITPRPDAKVQKMLADDGFEDNYTIVTEKHTFTAPFVNAEETQYLCIEDHYTNGRPPLELGGVLYCDRETVDKIEKMKVCTCLNPLHTAMSIYGCMLGYTLISAEMADEDLRSFIQKIGYIEAMPVVVDPGVLNPYEFIGAVINRRLPTPSCPTLLSVSPPIPPRSWPSASAKPSRLTRRAVWTSPTSSSSRWCWQAMPAT